MTVLIDADVVTVAYTGFLNKLVMTVLADMKYSPTSVKAKNIVMIKFI